MVNISEKEKYILKDLQDQEKLCIEKYAKYESEAKDSVLKELFSSIREDEEKHFNSLSDILNGTVPTVGAKTNSGESYNPSATYVANYNKDDKENDNFLCIDSITTEKYVSSAYNFDLYQFADTNIRKLLNHIETEEQNHAEKIYKYRTVNGMTQ